MSGEIKIKKLVLLALGLSLAINFSEIMYYFDLPLAYFRTSRSSSIWLIAYRLMAIFLFCFFTLHLNIFKTDNWLKKINAKYTPFGLVAFNAMYFIVTFFSFVYIHEQFKLPLHQWESRGLGFVWLILLIICVLSASLFKLRANIRQNLTGQQQFVRYNKESQSFKHDLQVLDKSYLTSFLLPRKKVLEPVKVKDFALFFIEDGIVKGKTFDSTIYFIDRSIQELEEKLNPDTFFRSNRQSLINRQAVKHIVPDSYGKLGLALKVDHLEEIVISKLKSKQFKDWLVEFSA